MRATVLVFMWVLLLAWPARAQEWREYTSRQDAFTINFPGEPTITALQWTSQFDYILPGRVYSANRGQERYTMTVIDYSSIEQQGLQRAKQCPPGNAQCRQNAGIMGPGYWMHDVRSATMFAAFRIIQRGVKVINLAWEWQDMVEGAMVQVANADESRTFGYVAMHENKLYVIEGTVPKDYPEPGLFQQSLGWTDSDGKPMRYQQIIYSNAYHGMGVYPRPPHDLPGARGGVRPPQ